MNMPADINFVPDGNMESPEIVGWQPLYEPPLTLEKSTAQAHSGKQSLHVVPGATYSPNDVIPAGHQVKFPK